jgi:hypothetical protein
MHYELRIIYYLCSRFSKMLVKGCSRVWAEMIPSKPDTDNAGVGMIEYEKSPYFIY